MSMKNRFAGKCRSYLVFFLLAAVAALLFFPRVASAAAKPTAKQLKVTYRGFEYDNDTAKVISEAESEKYFELHDYKSEDGI